MTNGIKPEETARTVELRRSKLGSVVFEAYRWSRSPRFRGMCMTLALRLEGGEFYSATVRRILESCHGVRVGAYSYGACMVPGAFQPGVTVGRYVSVGPDVRVFLRDHPLDRLSIHPFFFNIHLFTS